MLIASTAAIIVSALMSKITIKSSMEMVREQNQIQMFAEYTRRYQEIIITMPESVYNGSNVVNEDVLRYMQLYFNLWSEEYDLWAKDAISPDVWDKWLFGIKSTMSRPIYQKAWEMEKGNYLAHPEYVKFISDCITS